MQIFSSISKQWVPLNGLPHKIIKTCCCWMTLLKRSTCICFSKYYALYVSEKYAFTLWEI